MASRNIRQQLRRRTTVGIAALLATGTLFAPAADAARKGGSTSGCSKRNPCDTVAPTISVVTPGSGATVSGTVDVGGTAADDVAVKTVTVSIDGGSPAVVAGTASWSLPVDTTALADGAHTIVATATDGAGNVGTATRNVTVDNAEPAPPPDEPPPPSPPQSAVAAPTMAPGTIGGWLFRETDRDGVYESDETPLPDQKLYLYDAAGTYLGNTRSDAQGWYQFTDRAEATYEVRLAPAAWWALRADWVPDTTGSPYPVRRVDLRGTARADLGWRPIVHSTDASSPISSYTGANGVEVQSFNDVVTAEAVYEALVAGSLMGGEAQYVTVRFAYSTSGSTAAMAIQSNGTYTDYNATVYVPYLSWLDSGDRTLFHEYGHAWSLYHGYMVQQDPTLTAYLKARGVDGDPRVGSSYGWDPREMIAEDYRQLFGTPNAQSGGQINPDIPLAKDVPGLKDFLQDTFTQPGA